MEGGRPEAEGGGDTASTITTTPSETQLPHVWPSFLHGPEELDFASGALLHQQLEEEMREVQNYVDHVRALTEARDALATEYERENEELRTKFTQLQLEHESQHKEVAELLVLEGLAGIVHSSPSEQVAYLLVERSTLLARMEALEQELGAPHGLGRPCAASLRVQLPPSEEPAGGSPVWEEAERALEGAPDRLRSAQGGIPALEEDLGKLPDPPAASQPWKARERKLLTDRLLLPHRLCFPEAGRESSLGDLGGGCFQQELQSCKSELLCLRGELQALQGAAEEERPFLHPTHEKLLHENGRLEAKMLDLSHECEQLNQCILRERKKEEEGDRPSCPEFPARGQVHEDQIPNQGGDGEPMCLCSSEGSQRGELGKPSRARQDEEGPSFLREIPAVQPQPSAHRESHSAPDQPCPPRPALGRSGGHREQGAPRKGAPQPQEEPPGPFRGPWQALSLLGLIEQQLRLEQEWSLELRRQNLQLQQENMKSQAELREARGKVLEASQGKLSQQKAKELELQLLRQSQATKQQLAQESRRAAQAEKRVQELEQVLQESSQLWETQATLGRRQLKEEVAGKAQARQSLQEEQDMRKRLEQRWEEQQQEQRRLWQEKEARLLQATADQQAQAQRQEGQLRALQEERSSLAKEHLLCQGPGQRLSEQQEKEALCEEQRQVLKQVDVSLRKQSEQHLRHKTRLRQLKEKLLVQEAHIWHLEQEAQAWKSQAEKGQLLIQQVISEKEQLFGEKQKCLEQLHSLGEAKQSTGRALRCLQSRVQLLDQENQQLLDRSLQLSLQVGILERALRSIHLHSLLEFKGLGFPECPLQRKLLTFPGFSFSVTRLLDPGGLCQALTDGQPEEAGQKALLSPLAFQSSSIGCLNLSVPRKPADVCQDQPGHPVS